MKVVLFCGGLGMRMGETSSRLPKPMITIGDRPILWHIMKYYATFGFTDFILCLGYKAETIKEYFLSYKEELTNDFVLRDGGQQVELLSRDIHDWSITFVSTGLQAPIGQRLKRIEPYIGDDEFFLANYSDVLTDAPLPDMIERLTRSDKTALFLASHPTYTFHIVSFDGQNNVTTMEDVTKSGIWINAGYFVFRREIFDVIREGEDLVDEPFQRLMQQNKLIVYPYDGFWAPMDTIKDRTILEGLVESGLAPWRPKELRQGFPAAGAA
jgi:glucose-1-phosphate cytidylyltransferase